jgi:glycosidase
MVRHFGNTNETRKPHGTIKENGCGKFNDINDAALTSLKNLGITHIWLTGVIEQASGTDYPGRPADDPALLKGKAGSPYAIRDYFDVCPDYAVDPANRLDEFKALLKRIKKHQLRTIIDFVPNHVARSYSSDVRPDLSFGNNDDTTQFFKPNNNFYYLGKLHPGGGPPLKLPTPDGGNTIYEPESKFGRVTGNNAITWTPSIHDWYETIKLNYGHNFTLGAPRSDVAPLPEPDTILEQTPDTWQKMDAILAHWQHMGVDGFRVDMAHLIPMEYWRWQLRRCRQRNAEAYFMAEAYDGDPAKLTEGNVLDALLHSGFNAVYDGPTYEAVMHIQSEGKWANDIDKEANPFSPHFHQVVRYASNHDEVSIASPKTWGGADMNVGRSASAILFGLGRGPIMIYNGQTVGEPADGAEGFGGDDARTSIFDYWSMPTLVSWGNNHQYDGAQLDEQQKSLRAFYGRLIKLCAEPAFTRGEFYGLNHANQGNVHFGRLDGEHHSGHWLYSFLRHDLDSGQAFLVVVNNHTLQAMENVHIQLPEHALEWLGKNEAETVTFTDKLGSKVQVTAERTTLSDTGLILPTLPANTPLYLEIR